MPPGGPPAPFGPKTKNIPKSGNPLKSLNWSKLPESKITGTVWSELNDEHVFQQFDRSDFDKQFSAFQKPVEDETKPDSKPLTAKAKELSVIDGRRSQNCIILLSKMKLTNKEFLKVILSMDKKQQIPGDLLDEITKFTPTLEETSLLQDHASEYDQMARADQYFFDLSRIPHHTERLSCLVFTRSWRERVDGATPSVNAVTEASRRVRTSKKLQKFLEYVLAFGNYMNRGNRGNAYGFRLEGLTKVVDTKSSLDRTVTLLHYIIDVCCSKAPEVLDLPDELEPVRKACRVQLTELEKELNSLRGGIKLCQKELEFHKKNKKNVQEGD
jgi:dishevelled associated activator of morphogenesis